MGKIQFLVFGNLKYFVHFRNLQAPHRIIVNISVNNFAEESEAIRAPCKLLQIFENLIFELKDHAEVVLPTLSATAKSIGVGALLGSTTISSNAWQWLWSVLLVKFRRLGSTRK